MIIGFDTKLVPSWNAATLNPFWKMINTASQPGLKNYVRFSFTRISIMQARVSASLHTMNDLVSMPPTGLLEKAVKLG